MAPQVNSKVDWTVARCNRLMRPLVTRIQKLRMIKDEKATPPTVPGIASTFKDSDDSDDDTRTHPSKETDPDWMSMKKKKTGAKAYHSSKAYKAKWAAAAEIGVRTPARKTHKNLRPGELSIPTPYLTRSSSNTSEAGNSSNPFSWTTIHHGIEGRKKQSKSDNSPQLPKIYLAEGEDEEAVASNAVKLFIDILNATNESPDPEEQKRSSPNKGTRSLWATCCAKFGTAIAEVEADPNPEEDGLLDAGAEYYAMAEDLELPVRKPGGRLQLRLIVRAHATQVIASAAQEGLITFKILENFLPFMLQQKSLSALEGELLLSKSCASMTSTTHGFTCPSRHRNMFYTHLLNSVVTQIVGADEERRLAIGFRQYTHLLQHPEFPVEWLATRAMLPIWKDVFRTLLDSKSLREIQDASTLLLETVALAVGLKPSSSAAEKVLAKVPADFAAGSRCIKCPRAAPGTFLVNISLGSGTNDGKSSKSQLVDALSNTVSSMSTMLSSFAIAHQAEPDDLANINDQVILSVINALSIDIARHHATKGAAATDAKLFKIRARRAVSILAATMLPQIAGCKLASGLGFVPVNQLVQLMKKLNAEAHYSYADPATILDCLPELICSIARGASQVLHADAFDTLRNLVRSLASPSIAEQKLSPSTALFLKQLAFSSAYHFAENSQDRVHYLLIDEIEKEIGQTHHFDVSKTPFRSSTKIPTVSRGFKWEEGICEWVLASPKPSKHELEVLPEAEIEELKKTGKLLDLLNQTEKDESSDDDLPTRMWETEVGKSNVDYLCDLINSSSPISGGVLQLPAKRVVEKKNPVLPEMRNESERVQKMKITQLKLPMMKRPKRRPSSLDSDVSDDELSFHGPRSRKRPSYSNLRSSSSGPSSFQSRSKFPRNAGKDDSEDELGFA